MPRHISLPEIESWDRFYRVNFISSLSGYKAACLVGTVGPDGQPNLAIFSNVLHLGAQPALVGLLNRPREATPHTLANIEASGSFSLNVVSEPMMARAHQCSAKYPASVSEFEAVGFEVKWEAGIKAPFVTESPLRVALQLEQLIPIALNNTCLIIGSVQSVWIEPELVQEDGFLALERAAVLATLGLDGYYLPERLARFEYAKPDKTAGKI